MSKDLASFLRRWQDCRPLNGGVPLLDELSLDDIGPLSKTLIVIEQADHATDGPYLRCVFAAEDHERMLGKDPAGLAMHHIFAGDIGDQIVDSFNWALQRSEPYYWRRDKGFGILNGLSYERLTVPVRDPEGGPDMIVGVFAWHEAGDDLPCASASRPEGSQRPNTADTEPAFALTVRAQSLPVGGECMLSKSDLRSTESFAAALETVLAPFRDHISDRQATRTHLLSLDVLSLGLRVSASADGVDVTSPQAFDQAMRPSLDVLRNALLDYTSSPHRDGHPQPEAPATKDKSQRLLGQRLYETSRVVRHQFAGTMSRHLGLTVGEATLLNTVLTEGSISIAYLSARLKLSEDAIKAEFRRLAEWRFVDWTDDVIPEQSFISLTKEGRPIAEQVHAMAARRQKWFEDHISREDMRIFYRTLDKLNELCQDNVEGLPFMEESNATSATARPIPLQETLD